MQKNRKNKFLSRKNQQYLYYFFSLIFLCNSLHKLWLFFNLDGYQWDTLMLSTINFMGMIIVMCLHVRYFRRDGERPFWAKWRFFNLLNRSFLKK